MRGEREASARRCSFRKQGRVAQRSAAQRVTFQIFRIEIEIEIEIERHVLAASRGLPALAFALSCV